MKAPTQNELVLALLRERGAVGITPKDALYKFGCFRLAARIYDLRRQGHAITSEKDVIAGVVQSYDRYWLVAPR